MRRNCNLELRLVTSPEPDYHHRYQPMMEESDENTTVQQGQEQLHRFCNAKFIAFDAAEIQARAIILLASRGMEHNSRLMRSPTGGETCSSPTLPSHLYSPTGGLSMKRSLQRFLQKRQNRIQATSPYAN
ncbi:hypothetical protein Tsubulata_007141 [Turnera subulata]|uniref:Protein TIFY 5A n=1 Tax=Turnera subulata TaxID=218843 RepID=A0A9Q0F410_9ROSI|nr:hypothetical protein Tsubulata_007141 [Turnera subulata]